MHILLDLLGLLIAIVLGNALLLRLFRLSKNGHSVKFCNY